MKVLLTHERFMPDFGGGGEYIVEQTALHLAARGVELRVLTTGDPSLDNYRGIPVTRMPIPRYRMNLMVRKIAAMAADADLIHTFNYQACLPSLIAGAWIGKPVVCTCLGLFGDAWLAMRGRLAGGAIRAWERFLLTRSYQRMLFLSDYSKKDGAAIGVGPERAVVACPGFESAAFSSDERDPVVLFASKFEPRKGIFDVLDVARALPQVTFRMIGWGPDKEKLQRLAPPNVQVGDKKTGHEYYSELARARIFFLPSKAETFGIALVEAMASGCAIVSSIPLEFEGARVKGGDVAGMISAIDRLWSSPGDCKRAGQRNIEIAAEYNWNRYTDTVLRTYGDVLAGARAATGMGGVEACL
jgi:glycosyltransferase involved in cell wall biosynthesis